MIWPRKWRRDSVQAATDSIVTAAQSAAEADALLGELVERRPIVDEMVERSQREVRLNGFTRRIELAMTMPYPVTGTATGMD